MYSILKFAQLEVYTTNYGKPKMQAYMNEKWKMDEIKKKKIILLKKANTVKINSH